MAAPVIVPATRTGGSGSGADRDAWIRSRHGALAAELERRGYPWAQAWALAMAPVAHWGDETGWGRSEYNYAPGNIRSVGQCARAHLIQGSDDPTPRPYCAFGSLDEGVARTLDLILAARYAPAWSYFVGSGDPVGWFERLLRAGWHPYSEASVQSFRSEYARVQRTVGPAPASGSSAWWWAGSALLAGVAVWILTDD